MLGRAARAGLVAKPLKRLARRPSQGPNRIISHHRSSSLIITHHHSSSLVIPHHPSSSLIIAHHRSSSLIIAHHRSSSLIIKHHHASSRIITHHHSSSHITYDATLSRAPGAAIRNLSPREKGNCVVPTTGHTPQAATAGRPRGAKPPPGARHRERPRERPRNSSCVRPRNTPGKSRAEFLRRSAFSWGVISWGVPVAYAGGIPGASHEFLERCTNSWGVERFPTAYGPGNEPEAFPECPPGVYAQGFWLW